MWNRACLPFLLSLPAITGSGAAQVVAQPPACKVVVHDLGDEWPATLSVHADGSVWTQGNPWLGGGTRQLITNGVTDLARLDTLLPGAAEAVAVVGTNGLSMLRWNHAADDYDAHPWPHAQLAGARAVRTTPFGNQHLVAVLGADQSTVYCFRYHGSGDGSLVTSFTMPQPVTDFAAFQHQNGTARLLLVTASGLTCTLISGAPQWILPGVGGAVLRCARGGATKALWLHRDAEAGWRLAHIGDSSVLGVDALDAQFAAGENLVAAFAQDCDGDGYYDLVAKTSAGISTLLQPANGDFSVAPEVSIESLQGSVCIPDVIAMHGGQRVRVVDEDAAGGVRWSQLMLALQAADGIDLQGGGLVNSDVTADSELHLTLTISADWLNRFWNDQSDTHLQVVSWRQEQPTLDGRLESLAESNVVHELIGITQPVDHDTSCPLILTLEPPFASGLGWTTDTHYWLTVRLVRTKDGEKEPQDVSDPVTFLTTLSHAQATAEEPWPFVVAFCEPGTTGGSLPGITQSALGSTSTYFGGAVVGVITRTIVPPPPPPPPGLPSPGAAVIGAPSELGGG